MQQNEISFTTQARKIIRHFCVLLDYRLIDRLSIIDLSSQSEVKLFMQDPPETSILKISGNYMSQLS
jgi:hypothetical protein